MSFGQRLQDLRQRAGMSQDALAERLEVSRQAVSRWERDETMPETEKVIALAEIFAVSTDYLLRGGERGEEHHEPPQAQETGKGKKRDVLESLAHLVKTKGYLLGWVLIVWGLLDLVPLVFILLNIAV